MEQPATGSGYAHRQKGILLPILLFLSLMCLIIAFLLKDLPPSFGVLIAAAIACTVLAFAMAYLVVEDGGDHLSVRFGPIPLFGKTIPYGEITAVDKGRSTFLSGWGIQLTRKGWLWNIGGFDYVYVRTDKKGTLIGTDDPDGLAAFLQARIRPNP